MISPRTFRLLIFLILCLDVVRWGSLVSLAEISLQNDAKQYWELGGCVASGDVLLLSQPIAYRTPGYPWLLGIVQWSLPTATPYAVAVLQGVLLTATNGLIGSMVYLLTRNRLVVIIAMLIALLGMGRASWICTVLTETLFTFVLTLHLWCCIRWSLCQENANRQLAWSASVGLSLAALLLVRPVAMYLWLVHFVAIAVSKWIFHRRFVSGSTPTNQPPNAKRASGFRPPNAWLQLAIFATCTVVPLIPWLARNQAMFDQASLTFFLGRNIWIVTYQDGAAASLPFPQSVEKEELFARLQTTTMEVDSRKTWQVSSALVQSGLNDAEADQSMSRVAMQSIRLEPKKWFERMGRRFVNFYRCVSDELPVFGRNWLSGNLLWCTGLAALTFSSVLLGFARRPELRPALIWFVGIAIYFGLITAVVEIPDYRYRMVLEPVLIVMAVLGCAPKQSSSLVNAF